jgi:hypothetical protein
MPVEWSHRRMCGELFYSSGHLLVNDNGSHNILVWALEYASTAGAVPQRVVVRAMHFRHSILVETGELLDGSTVVAENGKIYALRPFDYDENLDDELFVGDRRGGLPWQEIAVYDVVSGAHIQTIPLTSIPRACRFMYQLSATHLLLVRPDGG